MKKAFVRKTSCNYLATLLIFIVNGFGTFFVTKMLIFYVNFCLLFLFFGILTRFVSVLCKFDLQIFTKNYLIATKLLPLYRLFHGFVLPHTTDCLCIHRRYQKDFQREFHDGTLKPF